MKTPRNPQRRALSGDDLADIEGQFDECDVDGDQRIDFAEFSQLLENLGADIPPTQRRSRFDEIDSDRNGAIDRSEFTDWWRTGSLIP
jgi:Ca2+-binding EF-hand superfamily protein